MKKRASSLGIILLALVVSAIVIQTAHAQSPLIISQPADASAAVGSQVQFSVGASGPGTLNYQWIKNGTNLSNGIFTGRATVLGATTATLTLTNITTNDQSSYYCRVTNTSGSVTSSVATLEVIVPPTVTTQPKSYNTNVGATVTLSMIGSGSGPLSYQWYKDGTPISGATLSSYTLSGLFVGDSGVYNGRISNAAGSTTSSNAVLNVGIAPAITGHPSSLVVTQGQSATFTATASGTPLFYFWRRNGVNLSGATNDSHTIASTVSANAGTYTMLASNFLGTAISSGAVLTVYYPATITQQPASKSVAVGANFTLNVTASGNPAVAYQWRTNGLAIPGATASSYTVLGAQLNNAGDYDVVITNTIGSMTSSVAVVSVGFAPVVEQQPTPLTNSVGGTANFSCVVTGSLPLSLQWKFNGNPLVGETSTNLVLTNLQPNMIGSYTFTATNAFGGTASSNAVLELVGYDFGLWNGLVAYYPFNGDANDDSVGKNDGVVSGAVLATDRFGSASNCYSFADGAFIRTTNAFGFPAGNSDFTVSAWVKLAQLPVATHYMIFVNGEMNQFQLDVNPVDGTNAALDFFTGGHGGFADCHTDAVPWETNRWYQLLVLRAENVITVYRDTNVIGQSQTTFGNTASDKNIVFGYRLSATDFPLNGQLDEIRIYNRALSATEVAHLFAVESQTPPRPFLSAVLDAGPILNLSLAGVSGRTYVLESAESVAAPVVWQPIFTNTADTNGIWSYAETNLDVPQRFYRVLAP